VSDNKRDHESSRDTRSIKNSS